MKLFTFLLIDNSVVKQLLKPLYPEEEPKYPEYIEKPKNNRFYRYDNMPEVLFMSYEYTNIGSDVNESANKIKWGYVIIDSKSESDIKNRIELLEAIRKHKNWSIDKDNKKLETRYLKTSNFLTVDTKLGMRCYKVPLYRRYSGHLGAGREGKRTIALHELILKTKYDSFNHISTKFVNCKVKRTVNGVLNIYDGKRKIVYDNNGKEIENTRFHHKGHSFDNRVKYIMAITKKEHNDIHKLETKNQFIYRPKGIDYIEDFYSETINCDCEKKGEDCLSCSAVLRIRTEQQFFELIESLRSKEYRSLERRHIYDELNEKK